MDYKQYYLNQAGGQYSVFRGSSRQRGYGLGGMFRTMYRYIMPLFKSHALPVLKKGAQFVGSEAIKAASNIAHDAIQGEDVKKSFKQHGSTAVNNISNEAQSRSQLGNGRKRKTNVQLGGSRHKYKKTGKSKIIHSNKRQNSRRVADIFG